MPPNAPATAEQRVCSECPVLFVAGRSDQLTCSARCRVRKSRRLARGLPAPTSPAQAAEIMRGVRATVEEGAVAMANEIMRAELTPIVREHLTPDVLSAIGDMVRLLPDTVRALAQEINGYPATAPGTHLPLQGPDGKPILVINNDRRMKAIAAVHRATVLSPGLAPQVPTSDKAPPVAINFGAIPRPDYTDGTAEQERKCDICSELKMETDFVEGSSRCQSCHDEIARSARALVEAPTTKPR